jgi:c-di-GMP-binding flagellar brake protein YcgR
MSLQALLLSSDDRTVRILRRVLGELEIGVEHCADGENAVRKLTRQRFEAVIVDCENSSNAERILKGVRAAPCNKRAVAVALIDSQSGIGNAFDMGAHFVLYKPISPERAKTSFRAVRALMKREQRRGARITVEIPVKYRFSGSPKSNWHHTVTSDIGEGGMAIRFSRQSQDSGPLQFELSLPNGVQIEVSGEVAWENGNNQAGMRFVDMTSMARHALQQWIAAQNKEPEEREEQPAPCRLSDLSLGGCYLEMATPFPIRTRVELCMRIADLEVRVDGVVRVTHPEVGMGVEFRQKTLEQRGQVERFISALTSQRGATPRLMVEPVGLEEPGETEVRNPLQETQDPLLELFREKHRLPADAFRLELQKQRGSQAASSKA